MTADREQMIPGVYIDDAGTPGQESKSKYLHTGRKSWAAVIVPSEIQDELRDAMNIFLDGVRGDYGADELHFTDIYSGRAPYKNVSIQERGELINLMTTLFESFSLPILFQSSSPELLDELRGRYKVSSGNIGWFSLQNHEHFSLLALCGQVANFIRDHQPSFPEPIPVMIDEGIAKPGASLKLPAFNDVFDNAELQFRSTKECVYLQLADFAAFVIARTQWLMGKGELKERDHLFLESVSADRLNIINLPSVAVNLEGHTIEDYDALLRDDRLFKGFSEP